MSWVRMGEWSMQRGKQTISKAMVGGVARYSVWHGDALQATSYASFAEAAKAADLLLEIEDAKAVAQ